MYLLFQVFLFEMFIFVVSELEYMEIRVIIWLHAL